MREIHLNGYIDDDEWFGDEITPDSLHEQLYPPDADVHESLRIILNSYGGSCNAAVRMHDDLRAYPGNVHIIVSGTAASAATVLAMAADRLEMTQGSLWMIHDPATVAFGNERDMEDAIRLLRACKESIINVYGRRCRKPRDEVSDLMSATTWMDAGEALRAGFIDGIVEMDGGIVNAALCHETNITEAKKLVAAWSERSNPRRIRTAAKPETSKQVEASAASNTIACVQSESSYYALGLGTNLTAAATLAEPSTVQDTIQQAKPETTLVVSATTAQAEPETVKSTNTTTQQAEQERETPSEPQPVKHLGVPVAQLLKRLELIRPTNR